MSAPPAISSSAPAAPSGLPDQDERGGFSRWFRNEVHTHDTQLKTWLRGQFPSVRDVDDVVQESYLKVWRIGGSQPIRSAKAFLFRVARNAVMDLLRRERHLPAARWIDLAQADVPDPQPGTIERACSSEELDLLARAIETLPARCRAIVVLRKLEGMPQKQIAARLGVEVTTVQVQVARGMKKIEQFMRENGVAVRSHEAHR